MLGPRNNEAGTPIMTTAPRLLRLAFVAAGLTLSAPDVAAQSTTLLDLPDPAGPALLSMPVIGSGARLGGVVLVLPDAIGPDGRATPYVDALIAERIAVLEIGLAQGAPAAPLPAAAVTVGRQVLDADPRFRGVPVALLGFGEGASVALAWAGEVPVAALYPRCAAVDSVPGGADAADLPAPLLLLHPVSDPSDRPGACARLADPFGARALRHAYADATPGWDMPPVGDVAGPTLVPRDSATYSGVVPGLRYRPEHSAAVTHDAVQRVVRFVVAALDRGRLPASALDR